MKKCKFIKATLNGITVNMNTIFISDIAQYWGEEKGIVFINGDWWQTELTKQEILNIHINQ